MASNTDDIQGSMSKDIAALQQDISRLQKMIAAQGTDAYYELRDRAGKIYDNAAPKAKTAVAQIKSESAAMVDTARDHPSATAAALALAGAIGFLAGCLVTSAAQPPQRPWWPR